VLDWSSLVQMTPITKSPSLRMSVITEHASSPKALEPERQRSG
jgi:hypothetical protein